MSSDVCVRIQKSFFLFVFSLPFLPGQKGNPTIADVASGVEVWWWGVLLSLDEPFDGVEELVGVWSDVTSDLHVGVEGEVRMNAYPPSSRLCKVNPLKRGRVPAG